LSSVVVRSISPHEIAERVREFSVGVRKRCPEVRRIYWFGSWVNGQPTPGSDVDLCVVVAHSATDRRHRASELLPVGFPTGLDLVVYTEEEFARLAVELPAWHRCITTGRLLPHVLSDGRA
jgi:predicted nucleotidyltransferase